MSKRIRPTTKKKLRLVIQLLGEICSELDGRKPFFAKVCRNLARALDQSIDGAYLSFQFDIPTPAFHRIAYMRWGDVNKHSVIHRAGTLEVFDFFG